MIQDVTFEKTLYQPPPQRFEAGTGNIADAVGLGAAIGGALVGDMLAIARAVDIDAKGVHAVRLWRTPRAWTWRGGQIGWKPVRKWTWICNRQDLWSGGWFKPLLPENVREIV